MNEFMLTIGETTFGGRKELEERNENDIMDYGNLIWITLQRAKSAREAISVIDGLVRDYGYASSGETFSIADQQEVWVMEIIGKGKGEKGAVWAAQKIPDGYVSAHANQARIRDFIPNDPEKFLFSQDLIEWSIKEGYFSKNSKLEEFSFSDIFNPVDFSGARFCDARVWSFFNKINDDMSQYLEYAKGIDLGNRMPLYVKPKNKVSVNDVIEYMRDHYEDTFFDMTEDFGSFPFNLPYRWRPLTFKASNGKEYVNERAIATQQTGFSFISETRKLGTVPREFGITWFGVDDASTSVYFPVYNSITRIPVSFSSGSGNINKLSFKSSFWMFNLLAHFAYYRYNLIYPEIKKEIDKIQEKFRSEMVDIEEYAKQLYDTHYTVEAIEVLTNFSCNKGDEVQEWVTELFSNIFAKFFDGDVRTPKEGQVFPDVEFPGYDQKWYDLISEKTGNKKEIRGKEDIKKSKFKFYFLFAILVKALLFFLYISIK